MPVLILAVAAVIAFFAVLALLWVARYCERRQSETDYRQAPEPLFAGLSYEDAFDGQYALIWQIQVPALELVRAGGNSGAPAAALQPWFSCAVRSYPDLFEGHSFYEWLEFLEASGLARRSEDRVVLTVLGCELLHYCRMAG